MRAWRINELGHPSTALSLEDVPMPSPGPGQVLIRVEAGNVNFADILLCQGIYQDRPKAPFTPGLETSGVVEACGPGVNLDLGTRIAGMAALPSGGYADYALVRSSTALVTPDDVPGPVATVLYSTFQTSHVGLHHRAHLQTGEWLLVHAGASGVGAAAVQLGVAAGAQVIATAGGPERMSHCRALGAHHAIDYRSEDLYERVMEITDGHGVDVAFDPVGGKIADITRRLMAWEGRYLVIGFASGDQSIVPAVHVLLKNYSVIGLHWGVYVEHGGRAVIEAAHTDLVRLYRSGQIRPEVAVVPLTEVRSALEAVESRQVTGRLVVVPSLGQ